MLILVLESQVQLWTQNTVIIIIKGESVRINSTSGDFCSGFTSTTSESVSVVSLQQRWETQELKKVERTWRVWRSCLINAESVWLLCLCLLDVCVSQLHSYCLIFVIKDKVDMTSLIRRLVPAFSPQQSFSRMNSVDSVSVHQLITVCLSVCPGQTLSSGRRRCGRPGRPCRTCTRRCWWRTWSTPWTRKWSRTCKLLRPQNWTASLYDPSCRFWWCLFRLPAGGIMLLRTRSPHCRARPRTEPTPTAARSRPTCRCSWRPPVGSTHRWDSDRCWFV